MLTPHKYLQSNRVLSFFLCNCGPHKMYEHAQGQPSLKDTATTRNGKRGVENADCLIPAKKVASQSTSSMSQSTKQMSSANNDSVDCETMLNAALDSPAAFKNDNTSSKETGESEDDLLSELTKEYQSEASVCKKLWYEQ